MLARLDKGAANATVNRELATLKRALSLAIKKGKLHQKPVAGRQRQKRVLHTSRVLGTEERASRLSASGCDVCLPCWMAKGGTSVATVEPG
jgi:site-specific recombinase XerC